eukprot:CAMPEP_0184058488 /NCGR_PEP_ID=MMETSP0956-20121227/9276_1 /TAXON_ID=627963 /ORGANISM="Aplanochytrium sp, Strain PBS07" /LENGTH=47 /DNA_ID= /DNA_START= /DNA_END= /DNA_ORIENTATION=
MIRSFNNEELVPFVNALASRNASSLASLPELTKKQMPFSRKALPALK